MPAMRIETAIDIAAPVDTVRDALIDFRRWPDWSPWLYIEPDTRLTYEGEPGEPGHGYHWAGQRTGAGHMVLKTVEPRRIQCALEFLKPWRSKADVEFRLQESGEATRVVWLMDSKLPFFMFFLKSTFESMIRMDYDRGLRMLKDLIELGAVPSTTRGEGRESLEAQPYVGRTENASLLDIADTLPDAFASVMSAVRDMGLDVSGSPFVLYERMNIRNATCACTAALPIDSAVQVPLPVVAGIRPAGEALKFVHVGAYRHLGNAWSQAMSEMRAQKLKAARGAPPFERYLNDPEEVAESELITEIYMPLR